MVAGATREKRWSRHAYAGTEDPPNRTRPRRVVPGGTERPIDDLNGGNGDDFLDSGLQLDSIRGGDGRDTCTSGETRMSSCEA
jgi:hypothetical protein